jgi:hypothetical protein
MFSWRLHFDIGLHGVFLEMLLIGALLCGSIAIAVVYL